MIAGVVLLLLLCNAMGVHPFLKSKYYRLEAHTDPHDGRQPTVDRGQLDEIPLSIAYADTPLALGDTLSCINMQYTSLTGCRELSKFIRPQEEITYDKKNEK